MPESLDLGNLDDVRNPLQPRASTSGALDDISVSEFLKDTDRSVFGLSLPHRWASAATDSPENRKGQNDSSSRLPHFEGNEERHAPRPPSTSPRSTKSGLRLRSKLPAIGHTPLENTTSYDLKDVPITFKDQYRVKKIDQTSSFVTKNKKSWIATLSEELRQNLQKSERDGEHLNARRVDLCKQALHKYIKRQSPPQQSLLGCILKEYDAYLNIPSSVRNEDADGSLAQVQSAAKRRAREVQAKKAFHRRKTELEGTQADLQKQIKKLHAETRAVHAAAIISHTDLTHLLHSDQLCQQRTNHDDPPVLSGGPSDVRPTSINHGNHAWDNRSGAVVQASSTLTSDRLRQVYHLQQEIIRLERDIAGTETFLATETVSSSVTDGLESMISDTEQQLRMVEIRKGMLLDKLSTLPAATTQPAGEPGARHWCDILVTKVWFVAGYHADRRVRGEGHCCSGVGTRAVVGDIDTPVDNPCSRGA
eukprot:m.524014 g.524014  ORF g.524014 m.524014 type:complete len:478 (-) comp21983_c0_seq12:259-1692(-)